MPRYISLLRGINVGGHKKIKMAELKAAYEELGLTKVKTYIQSGNVLFNTTKLDKTKLSLAIQKGIVDKWGFEVTVWVIDPKEWSTYIENNPFLSQKDIDTSKLHLMMLQASPEKDFLDALKDFDSGDDEFKCIENVIYLHCPNGQARTKLNNNFFERKLKVTATTRNWRSSNKLLELANIS
ncbi:MAG: DUF1697 domain-containing protein [Aureispira sp.]|nr:DUF1697 domain-containing protein [Aureispira sp.]